MVRIALILGALFVVGLAGAFLLYVSVLSIFTAVVILIGLVATLVLGYWAGFNSLDQRPQSDGLEDAPR
jgi:predicted ferric reductase